LPNYFVALSTSREASSMVMKTEFDIYPNEPRRFWDEVIAAFLFGWRWLPYTTSKPRKCWVFCPPTVRTVHGLPGGQVSGPTSGPECEIKPNLERITYLELPEFSQWLGIGSTFLAASTVANLHPAVREAIDSAQKYEKSCPESIRQQSWHPSYPALVIPVRRMIKVAVFNGSDYETLDRSFAKQATALSYAETAAGGEVDVYNQGQIRVKSLPQWKLPGQVYERSL
jgi:hypothetical protein